MIIKFKTICLTAMILIGFCNQGVSQFNKLKQLRDKVKQRVEKIEDVTGEEIDLKKSYQKVQKMHADKDTASFNFALAAIDNVSFFEDQNNFRELTKVINVDGGGKGAFDRWLDDEEESLTEEDVMRKANRYKTVGEIAFSSRKFKAAEKAFNAGIETLEANKDPDELLKVKLNGNLGLLYQAMGRFTLSEQYTQTALNDIETITGEQSYSFASLLNNQAVLFKDLGKYSESEKLIEQALKVLETEGGTPYYIALNNKAILYQALGRYDQAIAILEGVLAKPKKERARKSTTNQKVFINLALIYEANGEYVKAEKIYLKAIEIKQDQWKKNHPDYAYLLTNLASLYLKMDKESERVEKALLKAHEINKDNYGSDHFVSATSRVYLGNYYRSINQLDKAEKYLDRAYEIRKETYDSQHPLMLGITEDLAILKWEQGKMESAAKKYKEVIQQTLDFIRDNFPSMSETEKTKFWSSQQGRFYRYFSFIQAAHKELPDLADQFFEIQLKTKGILLSASTKIKSAILSGGNIELKLKYLEWVDLKENLAALYSYSNEQLNEEEINIDSLEQKSNELEKWLSEATGLFDDANSNINYSSLTSLLKDSEALVDLVRFPEYKNGFTGNIIYAALVGKKEVSLPELSFLNNGSELEGKFFKYYRNTTALQMVDDYSYENYWAPIDQKLQGISTVYLAKDGIYNQVSLPTLQIKDEGPLVNSKSFVLLTNVSDLAGLKSSGSTNKPESAFLMGFPTYGSKEISALPGTKVEIDNIDGILRSSGVKIDKYLALEATESNLKKANDHDIVHVATHGFFLQDASDGYNEKVFGINVSHMEENVFLRSGIMLSGAGGVSEQSGDFASEDNGIVTAYEILNYPLENVEMVVLSACETGLGEIKAGEGVYGLQRSLLVAGANTLLMSLWKVDDQATQDFMTTFYQNWVTLGDKYKAFRNTQLAMSKKYDSSYYWGAFVIMGR